MDKLEILTEKEYRSFFYSSEYNHVLQSYEWGQVTKTRKQEPLYIGLKDSDGNIKAACLVLKKHIPLINKNYYYSPRGILIDYNNYELLERFFKLLKIYLKKNHAIYFKMDPGIKYEDIDDDGNPIENSPNKYELVKELEKIGLVHRGFNKSFENNQPRYTFRIDTTRPFQEIEKGMNKSFLKKVKKSYYYEMEITHEYDNDKFYELMTNIANKDNFNGNPKATYEKLYQEFSKYNMVEYFSIKLFPDKILQKVRKELNELKDDLNSNNLTQAKENEAKERIPRLEKDIATFEPYEGKYPDGIISLIQIAPKTNKGMWLLFIGNNNLATYTYAVNRNYYEATKYAAEQKLEFLDLYGTVGDPKTKEKNYAGIHEYKKNLGGTYTEFIGEFDLIIDKFWFKVLPIIITIYRKLKKSRRK